MSVPGTPKLGSPLPPGPNTYPGVYSIGGDLHGGHGYKNAVLDDNPIRFGILRKKKPASSQAPPDLSGVLKKRRYYQGRG